MARTNKSRMQKACKEMKDRYDISEEKVELVLENLLELYDNKWDFIEDGDYNGLFEAIIEWEKDQEEMNKSNGLATSSGKKRGLEQTQLLGRDKDDELEEYEIPLKTRLRPQRRGSSSSLRLGSPVSKKVCKEEPNDVATNRGKKKAQLVIRDEDDDLEEDEAPLKRLRSKRASKSSPSLGSPISKKVPEEEPKDVATNRGKKKAPEQTQLVVRDEDDDLEEDEIPLKKKFCSKRDNNSSPSLGSPSTKKARDKEPEPAVENSMPLLPPLNKRYMRRGSAITSEALPVVICLPADPLHSANKSGTLVVINNDSFTQHKLMLPAPMLEMEKPNLLVEEQNGEAEVTTSMDVPPSAVEESSEHKVAAAALELASSTSDALIIRNDDFSTKHNPMISDTGNCSSAPMLGMEISNLLVEEQNKGPEDTTASMDVPSSTVEDSSEHKVSAAALELASSTSGEAKISLTFEPATGELFLRLPSMEDLQRAMEEKYLQSHPGFSLFGFMKDMCSCYIDLAKNSTNQLLVTEAVSDLSKAGDESGAAADISMELVVVPECEVLKAVDNMKDITRGEENIEIPWVNELNDEVPSVFRYMPQSFVFEDAAVKFSLSSFSKQQCCSSSCTEDCLVAETPCNCAPAVDNGFAYTVEGVLKEDFLEERISEAYDLRKQVLQFCKEECPFEKAPKDEILEPCKGHLQRKAIKECCIKCGCAKRCGNRVVQRGLHNKFQVFFTPNGKGWGLRTLERLAKGAFVCEYIGEVLTVAELHQRYSEDKVTSPMILDAFWGCEEGLEDNKALCLDGTRYGNISRFLNHRCLDANLIQIPVQVETPDQHYYHVAFFTTRDIDAMEELTWDYGVNFDGDDYPMKPFECMCGSRFCRSAKRSKRSNRLMIRA